MTDLATHLAQLETHLARFRDKGILNLIGGQDVAGASTFETRSPTDDSLICTVARATAADIEREFSKEAMREKYLRAASVVKSDVDSDTWRAFELTVVNGQACDEVADLLGKSLGVIYAARSRIMRRLREQVQRLQESGL